jgi:hypothetical protein
MAGPKIITDYTDIGGYSASSIVALGDPITGYLYKTPLSSISTGIQGPIGNTGIRSFIGIQGYQGRVGIGFTGSLGVQGPQGNTGIQGLQGIGSDGLQGVQGLQGLQGYQGASPGFQSSRGFQGFQGINGLDGVQGNQGTQGYIGITPSLGIQGLQNSPIILAGTYGHLLVYHPGMTLSVVTGLKYISDTFFIPGYIGVGSGGTILSLNEGRVVLTSFGIGGLAARVGTGSSNVDITKRVTFMNNDVILNEMYSLGGAPKPGYINNNISRHNGTIVVGQMSFQSTYWSTSGIALSSDVPLSHCSDGCHLFRIENCP